LSAPRIGDRLVWWIAPSVFQHRIIRTEFWHPFSFLYHVPRCELEFYNFMYFGYMWVYFLLGIHLCVLFRFTFWYMSQDGCRLAFSSSQLSFQSP
jgi:hypothetical protein